MYKNPDFLYMEANYVDLQPPIPFSPPVLPDQYQKLFYFLLVMKINMMRFTKGGQIFHRILAPIFHRFNMMNVQKPSVMAPSPMLLKAASALIP